MKNTIIKYTFVVGFFFFLIACSVKKDRFINRNFHAVTTEYNVLYNGNIALDKGLEDINDCWIMLQELHFFIFILMKETLEGEFLLV